MLEATAKAHHTRPIACIFLSKCLKLLPSHAGAAMVELWNWDGWDRVAALATVCTAIASLTIATQIATRDRSERRRIEKYLRKIGEEKHDEHQGLRSAYHLSRHLGIPLGDVSRLAFRSAKIVQALRTREGEGTKMMFGYKGLARID